MESVKITVLEQVQAADALHAQTATPEMVGIKMAENIHAATQMMKTEYARYVRIGKKEIITAVQQELIVAIV
jgi:hypothetical protein